jgi:branched-chain amino acid transport system ATP-binding protein
MPILVDRVLMDGIAVAQLKLKAIHAGYGSLQILKGVTLEIEAGEIVTLIGPNGAGKSTLLKCIFGLLRTTEGVITLNGKVISGQPCHEIATRGIAFVLQRASVFPYMTIKENLEIGGAIRRDKQQLDHDIQEIFKLFPILGQRRANPAGVLSGGQRRVLEIARALVARPQILMLDEPTIGLAPSIVKQVFEQIRAINQAGVTIIMVEQNVRSAFELSTRGIVLDKGIVSLEGKPRDLLDNPQVKSLYLGE